MEKDERMFFKKVIEAFVLLAGEIRESREQRKIELEWFKSHFKLATKADLEEWGKKIMATQAEIIEQGRKTIASLKQVNIDIADTQTKINELKTKVAELEALIAAGGTIGQELVDVMAEIVTLSQAADDALPNPVVVPPPVV